MRIGPLLLLATTGLNAQTEPPTDLLQRVRAKISQSLDHVPRYTCTETVDRSQFLPDTPVRPSACDVAPAPRTHLSSSDRLRLDVAMAANIEIYSWVGESRFNDRDLLDIVHEGAISSGSFAAFLLAIFLSDDAQFTYNGDSGGQSEFGFRVPYEHSRYYYGEGAHRVITGYDGTFRVDAKSAGLTHLEVRTSQLPPETLACYATTTLDYSTVKMKGVDSLLPSASLLQISRTDGGKSENRMTFSNCHEFLGESTISFDDATSSAPAPKPSDGTPQAFPPGLAFEITLAQRIDTASAAAGDIVKAKLTKPIKEGSKTLAPAGAAIGARIVRIREYYGAGNGVALDLKLETVEVGGAMVPIKASPVPPQKFERRQGFVQRVELGTLKSLEDHSASFVFRKVTLPYRIDAGLESSWVTAP